jgi:FtsP/CotA-like multicopper oxidase with cupredoxin domain
LAVQSIAWPLSRRALLAGTGLVAAATIGPTAPAASQTANSGFLVLRARSGQPGPALRLRRGEELRVRLHNDTAEPTAIHWHGVRLVNAMDGVPGLTQTPVAPGATFDYRFAVPDAGTFWYHAPVTMTGERLRGPFGSLQVDEREPVAVDRDHLLLVDDRPTADLAGDLRLRRNERLRLRLINATGRLLRLRLERLSAWVMAIDGQPSEPFQARDGRVALGPGNRVDLFSVATLAAGQTAALMAEDERGERALLWLPHSEQPPLRPAPLPAPGPLPSNGLPERMDFRSALRPELSIGTERTTDAAPLFRARRGSTVVLACANREDEPRVLHVHGHSFRLLDRLDDGWKPFWLDTAVVPPRQTQRIAFVADNPGKWLIEAEPSVAWFEVR